MEGNIPDPSDRDPIMELRRAYGAFLQTVGGVISQSPEKYEQVYGELAKFGLSQASSHPTPSSANLAAHVSHSIPQDIQEPS